jgi:hypothetical protein
LASTGFYHEISRAIQAGKRSEPPKILAANTRCFLVKCLRITLFRQIKGRVGIDISEAMLLRAKDRLRGFCQYYLPAKRRNSR